MTECLLFANSEQNQNKGIQGILQGVERQRVDVQLGIQGMLAVVSVIKTALLINSLTELREEESKTNCFVNLGLGLAILLSQILGLLCTNKIRKKLQTSDVTMEISKATSVKLCLFASLACVGSNYLVPIGNATELPTRNMAPLIIYLASYFN